MAVKTSNKFGKIVISDYAIAMIANHSAYECYGVEELISRRFSDSLIELFNKIPNTKGVKVLTIDNKIQINIFAILKDGVNVDAVCEQIRVAVKYRVEEFTGMRVAKVAVHVVGVKV